jgi:dGTPase
MPSGPLRPLGPRSQSKFLFDALGSDKQLGEGFGRPGGEAQCGAGDEREHPRDDRETQIACAKEQRAGDNAGEPRRPHEGVSDAGGGVQLKGADRLHRRSREGLGDVPDVRGVRRTPRWYDLGVRYTPRGRERTEELERASLSTWAALSGETKGREREEEPDQLRTAFQQDCERILSSKAFRRLHGKAQSLLAPEGEGPRVRLTHTLGVGWTARTIARALRLNEDLTEAIALGHDLGATAFANAGEEALSSFVGQPFRHNEQGLRVVEQLEGDGRGLNLTWEVRDGILSHSPHAPVPAALEGQVVRVVTRIVSVTDELEDALRIGICLRSDVPDEVYRVLGDSHVERVARLVSDIVAASTDVPEVGMSQWMAHALDTLAAFVAERVHDRGDQQAERARGIHCLRSLVIFYLDNPDRLPAAHRGKDPLPVRTLDFVSGLTDAQALHQFQRLLLPALSG